MLTTTISNLRKILFGMIETLCFSPIPSMHAKLLDGLKTPLEETIPEEMVAW